MGDWIKIAKQHQLNEYLSTLKRAELDRQRIEETDESEKTWMDRVQARAEEINAEGFFIHVIKKENSLRLLNRGQADIEYVERSCFAITYKNIMTPTTLLLRNPIFVHHHRVVKVRQLNAHNIEEVLKFVVLGMKKYLEIAPQSRIEYNLKEVIQILKKDEHERA